jgi:hypothetical protein
MNLQEQKLKIYWQRVDFIKKIAPLKDLHIQRCSDYLILKTSILNISFYVLYLKIKI